METILAVIIIPCIFCYICIMCCGWYEEKKKTRQQKEAPVYDEENPEILDLENRNTSYVNSNNDYTDEEVPYHEHMYDETEVAQRAIQEHGTLLWTNEREVFINTPGGEHAEILFIDSNQQPNGITTLWIENSPCDACSKELIKHFEYCHYKPTIFVGQIYRLHNHSDREGLRQLLINRFDIRVWKKLHDMRYGSDTQTENYIRQLKKEV